MTDHAAHDAGYFDVVIVGSGPVGSAVARVLLEDAPDATVLMVEAGPALTDPPGQHISSIADPDRRAAAQLDSQGPDRSSHRAFGFLTPGAEAASAPISTWPGLWLVDEQNGEGANSGMPAAVIATNVGGLGSHWGGACPTPGAGEHVDFVPRHDFDRALGRARTMLRVTADEGQDDDGLVAEARNALSRLFDEGRDADRRVQPMPRAQVIGPDGAPHPLGAGDILEGLWTSDRLELRSMTVAREILTDQGRATGVRLFDRGRGAEYVVRAGTVFVAASTFQTPQLLFASGIRPAALGRYLNDQAQSFGTVELRRDGAAPREAAVPDGRLDILSGSFVPSDADDSAPSWDLPVGATWVPYERDSFPYQAQIAHVNRVTARDAEDATGELQGFVAIALFAPKDIRFEDRVEFSEERLDSFGLPAMSVVYSSSAADDGNYSRMLEVLGQLGAELGTFVPGAEPDLLPAGSSIHYQGSTRMGPTDDGTSVCDQLGRVWGVDDLFVGGNGVIPTPTVLNPTLTSVTLAIRGAEAIARSLVAEDRTGFEPAVQDQV